jgi:2-dehydropantoate 2-reductase
MTDILVVGPGAVGGLIAARLSQNSDNRVTLGARTGFDELILETSDSELRASVFVLTDPEEAGAADWILVATKAYDSAAAADWLKPARGPDSRIAILQNGVDHVTRFSRWFQRDRILPVIVDCPTERIAPGRVRQRGAARLTVPSGAPGDAFTRLFAGTGVDCRITDDFLTAAWWKLCLNAAGVVNALVLKPAAIAQDETAARLMRQIVDEAAAVGRAEGARLTPDIADEVVGIYRAHPPDSVNSIHADRIAGRPMEINLRNGIIVELGARHGIPTPCNDMATSLLKLIGQPERSHS